MVGFKKDSFDKKFESLNDSQQSIQTISIWVMHYRKYIKEVVQYWLENLQKETKNRKLTYIYLANEIIQNSRRKSLNFPKEFVKVLPAAFENISRDDDQAIKDKIKRVINIWSERSIYDKKDIANFLTILTRGQQRAAPTNGTVNPAPPPPPPPSATPSKPAPPSSGSSARKRKAEEVDKKAEKKSILDGIDVKTMKTVMAKILKFTAQELPVMTPEEAAEKVDSEKLIRSLRGLEKCSSGDETIRSKISGLPSEVYDLTLIDEAIKRDGNTDKWLKQVDDAQKILKDYNLKLAQEIEDRTNSLSMLVRFAERTKDELKEAEMSLGETKEKLRKCSEVREELGSHIASLPDLTQLPQLSLPSAVDLFHTKHSAASSS